jgi:hypothetical protein
VDLFASSAAVLQAIGHATGHLPARRRPSDAVRRSAVAVVFVLAEQVAEAHPDFGGEPWTVELPYDPAELVRRTGAPAAEVEEALVLLHDVGCLVSVESGRERRLRLSEALFEDQPAPARLHWQAARQRLERAGASLAPALAVLREIAAATGARIGPDGGPPVEISLPRLMDAALFRRTAVSRALADLERSGLIGRAPRAGREHSCRLLPAAFSPAEPLPEPLDSSPPLSFPAAPPPSHSPVLPDATMQAVVSLRFGGSEVRLRDGLACDVHLGADGVPVLEIRPLPPG